MKRLALAGTFAMIGGAATLLMVASILYSCRQGGTPHDMGNQSWAPDAAEHSVSIASVSNGEALEISLG